MSNDKAFDQTGDYMPKTDSGFRDWLSNFSSMIQSDWNRFGLTEADADIITGLSTQYSELYGLVQSNATRTPGNIAQKDAVKAAARATCRVYAMQIKNNQAVDNQLKLELGIHVDDPTPTPIPAPSSAPMLNILSAFSGQHNLRFVDENTPDSRAKPPGCAQLELYVHIGPQPVTDWKLATFVGVYTRNPIQYTFEPEDAGKVATYFARWRTAKGLAGPMSLGVAMLIAFGGPVDQQIPTGGTELTGGEDDLKIAA